MTDVTASAYARAGTRQARRRRRPATRLEPKMAYAPGIRARRQGRAQQRVALDVPPPRTRHAARPGPAVVLQLLPAPVPGQDPGPGAADPLLVPARLHHHRAVRDPRRSPASTSCSSTRRPWAPPTATCSTSTGVGFGQLVRNVHRWSAHLMVLAVILHLARTFFAGAYKKPREFNWVIGVVLLLLTLGLSFTGYLLPWDQLSYWAVTVGTNLDPLRSACSARPSRTCSSAARRSARAPCCASTRCTSPSCPSLVVLTVCIHIWRVRKDGFAVERSSVATTGDVRGGGHRRARAGGAGHRPGPPLRRPYPGARCRRPAVGHRRGAGGRRHRVHLAAPARPPRGRRARRVRDGARPRRGLRRAAARAWPTPT